MEASEMEDSKMEASEMDASEMDASEMDASEMDASPTRVAEAAFSVQHDRIILFCSTATSDTQP